MAPGRPRGRHRRRRDGVLADRDFRLVFAGQALSTFGDAFATVAVAFGVLAAGGSAATVGLVLAARYLPLAALLLVGGVIADRLPRRRTMVCSDLLRCGAQAGVAVVLSSGSLDLAAIVALQVLYGSAEAFFSPALTGLVAQIVGPARVQPANALLRMAYDVSIVAGPVLAGIVVATAGPSPALALDAATFAASAALLAGLRARPAAAGAGPLRLGADVREGWSAVRSRPWLCLSIGNTAAFSVLVIPAVLVLGPELARRELGGVGAWSLLMASFGAGAVLGSLGCLRLRVDRPAAVVAVLLAAAAIRPAGLASGIGVVGVAVLCFVAGAAMSTASVLWAAMLVRNVPPDVVSRVDSVDEFATQALTPAGYLLAGPLAAVLGLHGALALLTVLPLVASLATLAAPPVRRLRWTPEEAVLAG